MATTLGFKDLVDHPLWRVLAPVPAVPTAWSLAYDQRNDASRLPLIYLTASATLLYQYNVLNNDWLLLASPAIGGIAGGFATKFAPSTGPSGVIAAGATTSTFTLSTALPAAVGINQLANRGDGVGYKVRIVNNIAGGGGTEESIIVSNTGGTTPLITVSPAFSFTPATGARYEFLSGRVFFLSSGALGATTWRRYDVLTNSFANLTNTNLVATVATDSALCALDELYTPANRKPGEGFLVGAATYNNGALNCLTATATGAGTITGQATAGDAAVLLNQWRNFQIRIVEDTTTPTAVGQRRRISSHTAGPSAVYTLQGNWTVQPTATCKFVIENANDILLATSGNTVTYAYEAGFAADGAWTTAATAAGATAQGQYNVGPCQYANRGNNSGAGVTMMSAWGLAALDAQNNARHSMIYSFRGAAGALLDVLDIAAGANGVWSDGVVFGGSGITFAAGVACAYDGATNGGRYQYVSRGTQQFYRFDVLNRVLESFAYMPYAQGTASIGEKVAVALFIDGATKLAFPIRLGEGGANMLSTQAQR